MIPTLLVAGLVVGLAVRTWWTILVLAAGWAVWIAVITDDLSAGTVLGTLLLGAVNAGVGVAIGRGIRAVADRLRHSRAMSPNGPRTPAG